MSNDGLPTLKSAQNGGSLPLIAHEGNWTRLGDDFYICRDKVTYFKFHKFEVPEPGGEEEYVGIQLDGWKQLFAFHSIHRDYVRQQLLGGWPELANLLQLTESGGNQPKQPKIVNSGSGKIG